MELLKLIALDKEDLGILSAHLQDAVLRMEDMTYLPSERRFVVMLNRFDWIGADKSAKQRDASFERCRAALRIEKVQNAQFQKLPVNAKAQVGALLTVNFEETDPPAGYVTFVFAGGGAIRLDVECVEIELRDLGPTWPTKHKPEHPDNQ
jgi:hypothetical protein